MILPVMMPVCREGVGCVGIFRGGVPSASRDNGLPGCLRGVSPYPREHAMMVLNFSRGTLDCQQ